jgi:hypothetical protein
MVMHNTRAEDAPGCSLPRYFLVILQVSACISLDLDVLCMLAAKLKSSTCQRFISLLQAMLLSARALRPYNDGVQYAASVHAEKLKKVLHRAANRDRPAGQTIGKQYFNPRLVPEEVSQSNLPASCANAFAFGDAQVNRCW